MLSSPNVRANDTNPPILVEEGNIEHAEIMMHARPENCCKICTKPWYDHHPEDPCSNPVSFGGAAEAELFVFKN